MKPLVFKVLTSLKSTRCPRRLHKKHNTKFKRTESTLCQWYFISFPNGRMLHARHAQKSNSLCPLGAEPQITSYEVSIFTVRLRKEDLFNCVSDPTRSKENRHLLPDSFLHKLPRQKLKPTGDYLLDLRNKDTRNLLHESFLHAFLS